LKNKKRKWILYLILLIAAIFLVASEESSLNALGSLIVLFFCGKLVWGMIKFVFIAPEREKQEKVNTRNTARQKVSEIAEYKDGTLTLSERSRYLKDMIDYIQVTANTYHKTPEKLHYGSATVGGVTTGGLYKTGGTIDKKTIYCGDRWHFLYDGEEVNKIILTDKLAQEAQESKIKEYCKENAIIIVTNRRGCSSEALMLAKAGDMSRMHLENAQIYPTLEKVKAIISWIAGEV